MTLQKCFAYLLTLFLLACAQIPTGKGQFCLGAPPCNAAFHQHSLSCCCDCYSSSGYWGYRRGGGGRRSRPWGRGGRWYKQSSVTREQLDLELDEWMGNTRSRLDSELDAYMANETIAVNC